MRREGWGGLEDMNVELIEGLGRARREPREWHPDRDYAAKYAHACGYVD